MNYVFAFEMVVAVLLIAIATGTIAARTNFTAVVLFMIYGLLLALVWVSISAVDVALTEAAIGGGVTSMLLLGAAARLRDTEGSSEAPKLPMLFTAGLLCVLVSAGLAAVVYFLPDPAPTLAPMAMANLAQTGLGNPVAGVLFAYRALDTLLEKVVLLLALVGVWSLARDEAWGGVPGLRVYAQPNNILVFLAQVLPPIGIMVGVYMFWAGANQPGGAFQGGTVLAAMWLLVMLARLQEVPAVSLPWVRLLLVIGPVSFVVIGFLGFVLADAFLAYPPGYAKPLIIIAEATLTLSIGVTLGLLVAGPPQKDAATMNSVTLFGYCGAVLVGLGLFGLLTNPQVLRKILSFNVLGAGVFLLFGSIARRGAAAGLGGDPVPQALVITGIVVAFSATALTVVLLVRLHLETGQTIISSDDPPSTGGQEARS